MVRNFLAFLGLFFLTLIIFAGVAVIAFYYDSIGLVDLPVERLVGMIQAPEVARTPYVTAVEGSAIGVATAQWTNPLDQLPTATLTPEPTPTLTPIPRLSQQAYRAQTIERMKALAGALQRWLELNNRLAGDNALKDDPAWQSEVRLVLSDIQLAGHGLGEVGPPPEEYEPIDGWLNRIPDEVDGLKDTYERGLANEDPELFLQAGNHFTRIKEFLARAVEEMLMQSWVIE